MRVLHRIFVILTWLAFAADCSAVDSSRLFMATKESHVAFFLPVLHVPAAGEKDVYLTEIVEEVFRRSTVLYDESAGNINIFPAAIARCQNPVTLPVDSQGKLDRMYAEIEKHDLFKFPIPHVLNEINFAKIMVLLFGPVVPDLANLPSGYIEHEPQVSTELAFKYKVPHESIESMPDLHSIYCGLDLDARIKTIDALAEFIKPKATTREPYLSQYYDRLKRCAIDALTAPEACLNGSPTDPGYKESQRRQDVGHAKFILSERNRLWMKKIIARSDSHGIPFYAFGAEHFLANAGGPGLLTQLQQAGFHVTSVKSMSDIPHHIRQKAALNSHLTR